MSGAALAAADAATAETLGEVLAAIGEQEEAFAERFYEIFLAACPDASKLFGAFAFAEQEAMFREVLRSLLAWVEGEDWLAGNLEALGRSHLEYGVEPAMFDAFVDAAVACARERLPELLDDAHAAALEAGARAITAPMREAVAAG